jgi:hypothetical protein
LRDSVVTESDETPRQADKWAAAQLREGFSQRLGETIDTTGKLVAALASLGVLFFITGYFVQWQRLKRGELPPEEILPLIPQEQIAAAGVRELVVSLVFVGLMLLLFGFVRARLLRPAKSRTREGWLTKVSSWDAAVPALIVGLLTMFIVPLHVSGVVVAVTLSALTYYSFRLVRDYLVAVVGTGEGPGKLSSTPQAIANKPEFPLWRLTIAVFVAAIVLSGARQREFPNPRAKVTVVLDTKARIEGVFLGIKSDKVLVRVQGRRPVPRLFVLRSSDVESIRIRRGPNFLREGAPDSVFDATVGQLFDARFTCIPPECWAGYDTRVGPSSYF